MQAKLGQARASFEQNEWRSYCIHRVPWCLRGQGDDNYNAFKPRLVSLGPYHHGEPQVQGMQFHKYRMLHCILRRTGKDISEFLDVVKKLEPQARACYEDLRESIFGQPIENFGEMLVLDGCFILDFLVGYHDEVLSYVDLHYDKDDPIFSKFYMCHGIHKDMLLLENQIPLFVLNALYEVQFECPHNNKVVDLMFKAFTARWVIKREPASTEGSKHLILSSSQFKAGNYALGCLEIFWKNLMHDGKEASTAHLLKKPEEIIRINSKARALMNLEHHIIPNVTALKEAGVRLERKDTLPFWQVGFKGSVLGIPQIMIHKSSESIFLNLMAFELDNVDTDSCKITSYVLFMDSLVNSAIDVAELRAHGIIVGAGPSDEEVANLFNRLGKNVFIPFNQFDKLSRDINGYCNKRIPRWRANLVHNYFNSSWAIISVIAAAILMLLTIIQTGYTIVQYHG